MKARRAQVEQFRDHELNAVVTRTLSAHKDLDRAALERELEETRASARKLGVTDDASIPRIQELLSQIAVAEKLSVVSDDVFAHLFAFFSRYYQWV
jgi:adenine-specific DNA-methyltransferase